MGLRWAYNPRQDTVLSVEAYDRVSGYWSPLDDDKEYKLVTNSFLASGGDDHGVFTEYGTVVYASSVVFPDVFVAFLQDYPEVICLLKFIHHLIYIKNI